MTSELVCQNHLWLLLWRSYLVGHWFEIQQSKTAKLLPPILHSLFLSGLQPLSGLWEVLRSRKVTMLSFALGLRQPHQGEPTSEPIEKKSKERHKNWKSLDDFVESQNSVWEVKNLTTEYYLYASCTWSQWLKLGVRKHSLLSWSCNSPAILYFTMPKMSLLDKSISRAVLPKAALMYQ